MPKISPCLWFDNQAEEAANYYVSVFPNSKVTAVVRYDSVSAKASGQPEGSVMVIEFELDGQKFNALNGGPVFKFNESISFMVYCQNQEEIDHYWAKLSAVPESEQCGWCKDKFGVSWQIVSEILGKLLLDSDKDKAGRVMQAMLQMKKIDIAALQAAAQ